MRHICVSGFVCVRESVDPNHNLPLLQGWTHPPPYQRCEEEVEEGGQSFRPELITTSRMPSWGPWGTEAKEIKI